MLAIARRFLMGVPLSFNPVPTNNLGFDMKPLQVSKAMAIFHEVWRVAHKADGALPPIKCADTRAAQRLRFALYNAVKPFRDGKREVDEELREAMLECSVALTPDRCGVVIQRKLDTEVNKLLLEAIGGKIPLTIEERMANSAYERIMKRGAREVGDTTVDGAGNAFALNYGARIVK